MRLWNSRKKCKGQKKNVLRKKTKKERINPKANAGEIKREKKENFKIQNKFFKK